MCLICDKLSNNKMTLNEARRNAMELRVLNDIDTEHYNQILDVIKEFQKIEDDKKTESAIKNT